MHAWFFRLVLFLKLNIDILVWRNKGRRRRIFNETLFLYIVMHSLWPAIRASSYEASRNPIRVLEGTKHLHLLRGRIPFGEKISDRESNSWMYFFRLCPRLSNWKCRCSNGNAVLKMHAAEKFNSLEKKKEKRRKEGVLGDVSQAENVF